MKPYFLIQNFNRFTNTKLNQIQSNLTRNKKFIKLCLLIILLICSVIIFVPNNSIDKVSLFLSTNQQGSISIQPKVLCYILISKKKLRAAKIIERTWGRHCDKLIFFGNFLSTEIEITHLHGREGYSYLWNKTKSALIYLDTKYSKEFDWFVKGDHDTFFILKNLRKFITQLNPMEPRWFGYKLKNPVLNTSYMSGGAGYVISRRGLQKISALFQHSKSEVSKKFCNLEDDVGYEDLELGKCAIGADVKEIDTRDEKGRERFLPLSLSVLLNRDVSRFHWLWNQAWNTLHTGPECCSKEFISTHQISPNEMKRLYFLFYHDSVKSAFHPALNE